MSAVQLPLAMAAGPGIDVCPCGYWDPAFADPAAHKAHHLAAFPAIANDPGTVRALDMAITYATRSTR